MIRRLLLVVACAVACLIQLEAGNGIPTGVRNTDGSAVGNGVSIASTAATTDMNTGTVFIWARPDTVSNAVRNFAHKMRTQGGWEFYRRAIDGTALQFVRYRNGAGGTNLTMNSPTGTLKAGVPVFLAISWDTSTSANLKMYAGSMLDPATLLASTNTLGSGTALNSDSTVDIVIGNSGVSAAGWNGVTWFFGLSAKVDYQIDEIRRIQFHPGAFRSCIGAYVLAQVPAVNLCGNGSPGVLIGSSVRMSNESLPRVTWHRPGL